MSYFRSHFHGALEEITALDIPMGVEDENTYIRKRIAQCASFYCCGKNVVRKSDKPQVTDQNEVFCPDCGHALVWTVKKTRVTTKESR